MKVHIAHNILYIYIITIIIFIIYYIQNKISQLNISKKLNKNIVLMTESIVTKLLEILKKDKRQ